MKSWRFIVLGFLVCLILLGISFLIIKSQKPVEINFISPDPSSSIAAHLQAIAPKININTASLDELMTLPGIGKEKASSIIDFRENNGKFRSIEDLLYVPGIGQSIFEQIKEKITV